ncbi:MAG: hypothetical protein JNL43_02860 [Flavobacteriales bacterium]|nr:hypothetical protein [Flavobacteriales bacterium]
MAKIPGGTEAKGADRPQVLITLHLLLIIAFPHALLTWLSRPAARWIILGAHLLFLLGIFLHQGVLTDKEALKYVGCATEVLHGDFHDLTGNYLKYGAYVLFLLPFVALGSLWLAVLAQIGLGISSAFALSRIVARSTGSKGLGNLSMAVLLLCYPVQLWTLALYTESFFTSLGILFIERITRTEIRDAWTLVLGLLTLFARPVGILFVGTTFIWKWTGTAPSGKRSALRWIGYCAVFAASILLPGIKPAQLAPIVEAHVIAGMPGDSGAMESFTGSSIGEAQVFLWKRHGAIGWLDLAVRRMCSLFTLNRPYYSIGHNLFAGTYYVLYPLAMIGLWRWRKEPAVGLVTSILVSYTLLIGLTHDEWGGRFLVPILPWILFLAAQAFHRNDQGVDPAR